MEPATTTVGTTGPVHFLNIEYIFRLIYETVFAGHLSFGNWSLFFTELWTLVTAVAYLSTIGFLVVLAYASMRLHQVNEIVEHKHTTIEPDVAETEIEHERWTYVSELIETGKESDWRQAIIEADIMLDDIMAAHGFVGNTVADKLKQADERNFHTLRDAWDAHMVRNQIAHQGSEFPLTEQMAYRTIAKFKNVFEEFHAI